MKLKTLLFMKILKDKISPLILLVLLFLTSGFAQNQLTKGIVRLETGSGLEVGKTWDLTGDWFYRPGYEISDGERQERIEPKSNDYVVRVPQFLNRVRWWLDDSEDFKKHEEARLKKMGFDMDRAEDGWYKLILETPGALPDGKRVFIEFEGVAMKSRVFLNGQELGDHTGMFSRFSFDLTPHLKAGKNLLAVYVSMERIPVSTASLGQAVSVNLTASKVLSLSKGMFGPLEPVNDNRAYDLHGIWQPVKLVVRGAGKLDDVYFQPSLVGAKVNVEMSGVNSTANAVVKARWVDRKTNQVLVAAKPVKINLNSNKSNTTLEVQNVKPELWTPANPNLYRMEVTLENESGEVLDVWRQNVGFRTFEVRGNQLYLNGNRYWLRGANHLPYGKNPWDGKLSRKLIQAMHNNNQRITRTHATPWNEAWLEAADEIGLGVSIEGIRPWAFVGKIGATPPDLFKHWLMENGDVVRRIRNHPSVFIWTIGNEMLLRDHENPEKWGQLSAVVKQTRELDPTRPVIVSSSYVREAELYNKVIKPNNIDDGDIDAMHSYKGWYADSPFVTDSHLEKELKGATLWKRPFIGQEMSTGYPDLDTGLPVLRYTKNQVTPQAWVGVRAYPGNDPAFFLEHQRAVTKRWAEQLRFQRGDKTAGFMLFANECWFSHSYDEKAAKAYPVVEAIKYAWSPVGLALETARRRFYAGETVETSVFVTNDDEQFQDLSNLQIEIGFVEPKSGKQIAAAKVADLASLKYYQTAQIPIRFQSPNSNARSALQLVTRLLKNNQEISRTVDFTEVFPPPQIENKLPENIVGISLGKELQKLAQDNFQYFTADFKLKSTVLIGKDAKEEELNKLKPGGVLNEMAKDGSTIIVFSPGKKILDLFPNDVLTVRNVSGEFADLETAARTKFAENLQPMDLKWWGRKNDWRVMVATEAHRLKPDGRAREIIRFIPAHGYIASERISEQFMTVLFEIPVGKGRIWVCDLDIEESVSVDPAARIFAVNLLRAAADQNSTKNLPVVPTHEELLAGKKIAVR